MNDFITTESLSQLKNEYNILHLIYHRNSNQHRLSVWWKYLNILRRNIRKILKLIIDIERTKNSKTIRQKKQDVFNIVRYLIKKKIFTKAYYEFNGIIALGQFITLGLALVGNLSKIYCILRTFEGVDEICKPTENKHGTYFKEPTEVDDLGEIIEYNMESKSMDAEADIRKTKDEYKNSKMTKKSNDIDDIFASSSVRNIKGKKPKRKDNSNGASSLLQCTKSKKKKKKNNEIDDIFNL